MNSAVVTTCVRVGAEVGPALMGVRGAPEPTPLRPAPLRVAMVPHVQLWKQPPHSLPEALLLPSNWLIPRA